jgi:hypothetical protein
LQFDEWKPVAPRLRAIPPPASAADLHSVLAKIQEDAEARLTETARANLRIVDMPQSFNGATETFTLHELPTFAARAPEARVPHAVTPMAGERKSRISGYGIASSSGRRFVTEHLSATREFCERLDLDSKVTAAIEVIQSLQLQQRIRAFASRVRTATEPAFTRLAEASGPEWKARAVAARDLSLRGVGSVRRWFLRNFTEQAYGKSFAASAVVAALLYLVARGMNPAEGWQHPARLILSFAGLLLCGVSVAIGATILIRARHKLAEDSSELLIEAVRWLQAPIPPLPLRRTELPRQ